jgi:magnesium chelatase family protein
MTIEVFPVEYEKLERREKTESSAELKMKVEQVRELQKKRFHGRKITTNSEMGKQEIEEFCVLGKDEKEVLQRFFHEKEFGTRRYFRILKLARTIGDVEGSEKIQTGHLMEAVHYCNTGNRYWEVS